MYMTLEELRMRLNETLLNNPKIDKNTLVVNVLVVQDSDSDLLRYHAPGTVLFNCVNYNDNTKHYQLSINPGKVSKWPN